MISLYGRVPTSYLPYSKLEFRIHRYSLQYLHRSTLTLMDRRQSGAGLWPVRSGMRRDPGSGIGSCLLRPTVLSNVDCGDGHWRWATDRIHTYPLTTVAVLFRTDWTSRIGHVS